MTGLISKASCANPPPNPNPLAPLRLCEHFFPFPPAQNFLTPLHSTTSKPSQAPSPSPPFHHILEGLTCPMFSKLCLHASSPRKTIPGSQKKLQNYDFKFNLLFKIKHLENQHPAFSRPNSPFIHGSLAKNRARTRPIRPSLSLP